VATYSDLYTGVLVVQDRTTGFRIGDVALHGDMAGQQVEVCGETRPGTGGMTLARPQVKILGAGKLPAPVSLSADAWLRHAADWQWVEIHGLAYAETVDHLQSVSLHMVSEGRRIRVHVTGAADAPVFASLMGSRVQVRGVAARPADGDSPGDLVLDCPDRTQVNPESPQPASLPPLTTAEEARQLARPLPSRRVRLRGSITQEGPEQDAVVSRCHRPPALKAHGCTTRRGRQCRGHWVPGAVRLRHNLGRPGCDSPAGSR
jgi:hypothetical protein